MTSEKFSCLVYEAEKSLYRVAKSILQNDEDCADAIQNSLLKAYDNLGSLKHEKYFKTWLTRILINECYQLIRKQPDTVTYDDAWEASIPSPEYSEVFTAIKELSKEYRIPFVLHYVEGYSVKEVSKILDISQSLVKTRLFRARAKLQTRLQGEYDERIS